MKAYKGMDKNMRCRGFRFEIGKTYEEPEAVLCEKGFHACVEPLDVFQYYYPGTSRYFEVELDGVTDQNDNDSKIAARKITIVRELTIDDIIDAQQSIKQSTMGGNGSAMQGGDGSAMRGGARSAMTGGAGSILRGGAGSVMQGGYGSAMQGGNGSAMRGGNGSAMQGGDRSAMQGGNGSVMQGGNGSAMRGGARSAMTGGAGSVLRGGAGSVMQGGYESAMQGGNGSVMRGGCAAKVRGGMWSVLALERWIDGEFKGVACGVVDGVTLKPDTWYHLNEIGEFEEVDDDDK